MWKSSTVAATTVSRVVSCMLQNRQTKIELEGRECKFQVVGGEISSGSHVSRSVVHAFLSASVL